MARGRRGRRGRRRPWAALGMVAGLICLVAGAGAIGWAGGTIQAPATTSAAAVVPTVTGDPRVDALLARMSLAQKLRLLDWVSGASQAAVLPGLARLGIPALHLTEGALGSAARPAPAMAAPLAVAATFSQADAYANGMVLGRDARALGEQAVARPFAGIDPSAATGPAGATFGEDPLLAGRMAAAQIAGIQAQGTMALVQSFLSTGGTAATFDPTALHEIYLQPFADAAAAGAAGVLCSPGSLAIVTAPGSQASQQPTSPASPACSDPGLLSQILRRELGFGGFVVADRGANPGMVSLDAGLDGEIPGASRAGGSFALAAVRAAVANGTIGQATINQAAGLVLAEMDRFGLLGRAPKHRAPAEPVASDERVVARTAQDAATLLKNAGPALPLSATDLGSLALIGPGAERVIAADAAGGNGTGIPSRRPGPLQVLRQDLAGDHAARLSFTVGDDLTGTPVPASALSNDGQPGLARAGAGPARVVSVLDNTATRGDALPAGSAHTWTGELTVPAAGSYWINLALGGARGTLSLDGTVVAQDRSGPGQGGALAPTPDGLDNLRARVTLTAGTHTLTVTQVPDGSGGPVQVRLDWVTPAQQQANVTAAIAAARDAKAAVVFAWGAGDGSGSTPARAGSFDGTGASAGDGSGSTPARAGSFDGTGASAGYGSGSTSARAGGAATLPDGQDQLIKDVAAANPDTIVVLNTPGPVSMPWLSAVKAVLEMWYPGDGGGSATANLLLGRADPAGRLPVTWPVAGHSAPASPEGVFEGYRWYDHAGVSPLFPFGYGLSYTQFRYSGLSWRMAPGGLVVRFRVTNSGRLAGDEVPQVYLGAPAKRPPGVAFAAKALAGYTRISLRPGQTKAVTLLVPRRQLQYWDDTRGWVTAAGRRPLDVGPSERADALSATVTIPG